MFSVDACLRGKKGKGGQASKKKGRGLRSIEIVCLVSNETEGDPVLY